MTQYSLRPTKEYKMPLAEGVEILRPETAILRFSNGPSLDVGALCYLRREMTPKTQRGRKRYEGRHVDPRSLDPTRIERVRQLIAHVSDSLAYSGRRTLTINGKLLKFLQFINWADANGHTNVLTGEQGARLAVRAYATYLREQVNINKITRNSGARLQSDTFAFVSEFMGVNDLIDGLNLLRKDDNATESTQPPSEDVLGKVLALCETLFSGICELVLKNKPYPFQLKMPKYLGWEDNNLWMFPVAVWCMPPHIMAKRHNMKMPHWGYDYSNGRVATLDELRSAVPDYEYDAQRRAIIRVSNAQIKKANSDPQNTFRRQAAALASEAFRVMFMAHLAPNSTPMMDFAWDDDKYTVTSPRQQLRSIKYRAGGKKVSFDIPGTLMPAFKDYLKIRRYLLNGRSCSLLFFKVGNKATGNPEKINDYSSRAKKFFDLLQYIDPGLPRVTARELRVAKGDWLIRKTDTATASLILQNEQKTVEKSYAAGSEVAQQDEITEFLDRVAAAATEGQEVKVGVSRATGYCSDYGNPGQISDGALAQPNCKEPEGCLFCDKLRVHADEQDTRKLLSCRYCIQQTATLFDSKEDFDSATGPILNRINQLLDEIALRDKDLVSRITDEVDEKGRLDGYWAGKYQIMLDLGWAE